MNKNVTKQYLKMAIVGAALGLSNLALAATPAYTITDLGDLGGGQAMAQDINQAGTVVGSAATGLNTGNYSNVWHAFSWDNGTLTDLGTLPGGSVSSGNAVNNRGQVVGYSDTANGEYHGFLWSSGTMTDLVGMYWPMGINASGQVVGFANTASGVALWSQGTLIDLGTLPGGTWSGLDFFGAGMINNRGQVVGYGDTASGEIHAFLWSGGTMTDLGTLPGGTYSYATSINNQGQVVGYGDTANFEVHAFLWERGTMTDLGTLPGGTFATATAINDLGQVVGTSKTATDFFSPFLYSKATGMVDLYTLLPPGWGQPQSGSTGSIANIVGINNQGQIVGYGCPGGSYPCNRALLLTPAAQP